MMYDFIVMPNKHDENVVALSTMQPCMVSHCILRTLSYRTNSYPLKGHFFSQKTQYLYI